MAEIKVTEYDEATSLVDTDLFDASVDIATTPVSKKITWANIKAALGWSTAAVAKTIATGDIEIAANQSFVTLTGEGDTTDVLDTIGKTGGGELDEGHEVTLKGKAALGYTITIVDGTYFHLQANFPIMNEYDNITLKSVGLGHWIEKGGRVST